MEAAEITTNEGPTCAHAAIINVLRLRGRPTPTVEQLEDMFATWRVVEGRSSDQGVMPRFIATALAIGGLVCGVVTIPPDQWSEPRALLCGLLDQGFTLIVFYNWRDPGVVCDDDVFTIDADRVGQIVNHVTIARGYCADGLICVDSEPLPAGYKVGLTPTATEIMDELGRLLQSEQENRHGSEIVWPYSPCWKDAQSIGLSPLLIAIWPERGLTYGR